MSELDDAIAAHLDDSTVINNTARVCTEAEPIPPASTLPKREEADPIEAYRNGLTVAHAARVLEEREQKRINEMWDIEQEMSPLAFKINRLLATGDGPRAVAERLGCSVATVYRSRDPYYQTLCAAEYLVSVGASRPERAAWLRQIAERSMDDTDAKWFNPKVALSAVKLMAEMSGDLTPTPTAVAKDSDTPVQVIINLGDYNPTPGMIIDHASGQEGES